MKIRLEYLLFLSFLFGVLIAYAIPFKVTAFSTFVDIFVNIFLFFSPLIVFVIIFNSTCSLVKEMDQAEHVIRNSLVLFGLLVLCCSIFASLVLASLSPTVTVGSSVVSGALSYVGEVVFLSALRPVSLALVLAVVLAFIVSRTQLFVRARQLSQSVYAIQGRIFGVLLRIFPVISLSLGSTLYYSLGSVSLEAYVISMGLTLALGVTALVVLALLVRMFAHVGFGQLGNYSTRMFAAVLAIGSSYVALPIALKIFRNHFNTPRQISDLVLTLGTSLNRCGSVMGVFAVSYVAARYTGVQLFSAQILLLAVPLAIIGFGAPGIQGGTLLVSLPLILDVIRSSNASHFAAVALAIFVGGTTFIQAAVNNVASGYVALLIAPSKARIGPYQAFDTNEPVATN